MPNGLSKAYGQFIRGAQDFFKASPEEMAGLPEIGKDWEAAIEAGDIPFDPVGLGVAKSGAMGGVKAIRKYLAKTWGQGRKGLPQFRSTEDAMTFGADHAGDQGVADLLRSAQKEAVQEFKSLPKGSQARAEKAFEGQFYREALETAEGKTAPHWLERFGYKGEAEPFLGTTATMKKIEPGLYKQHIPTISEKAAGTKSIDALLREFHELGRGTKKKLFRKGRPEGKWWSESEEYVARGFPGLRKLQKTELPKDIKLLDLTKEPNLMRKLMTSKEKAIVQENVWGGDRRKVEAVYDRILKEKGYGGFKMLDEGEQGKLFTTYYLRGGGR